MEAGRAPQVEPERAAASQTQEQKGRMAADIDRAACVTSPDAPLLIRQTPSTSHSAPFPVLCNTGRGYDFETGLFKGRIAVWAKGLKSSPSDLFGSEKRRTSWIVIQGRFKKDLELADIWTGQRLDRPLRNVPRLWGSVLSVARLCVPRLRLGTLQQPFFMMPLATTSQCMHATLPGCQPPPLDAASAPVEDLRALSSKLTIGSTGEPLPGPERRKWFRRKGNAARLQVNTSHIYTFHLWQHQLNLGAFEIELFGSPRHSIANYLDGQPLKIMACTKDQHYLWNFEIWHENLFPATP